MTNEDNVVKIPRNGNMKPIKEQIEEHTAAVLAARRALADDGKLPAWTEESDEKLVEYLDNGPHVALDGKPAYVHAFGCLYANLGDAFKAHPDWYIILGRVNTEEASVDVFGVDPKERFRIQDIVSSLPWVEIAPYTWELKAGEAGAAVEEEIERRALAVRGVVTS